MRQYHEICDVCFFINSTPWPLVHMLGIFTQFGFKFAEIMEFEILLCAVDRSGHHAYRLSPKIKFYLKISDWDGVTRTFNGLKFDDALWLILTKLR
jgi:hypothetical protein